MFKKFGDYLFYLLPGPLKSAPKNQLSIFFEVIGRMADEMKEDMFRFRKETLIETASPIMLQVFGLERNMARMKGEKIGTYRKRLQMKAVIARMAGTEKGILLALESIGYPNSSIEPLWKTDPDRWAEIYVKIDIKDTDDYDYIDSRCAVAEIMKVKKASTLPVLNLCYRTSGDVKSMAVGAIGSIIKVKADVPHDIARRADSMAVSAMFIGYHVQIETGGL